MDYDLIIDNSINQNDKYSSSASSTASSTSEQSFMNQINNLKLKMNAAALTNPNHKTPLSLLSATSQETQQQQQQQQQHMHNFYSNSSFNTSMPSSCSLIFSTAANFNINQNDTVYYSRESIHLLAKFLANNSEHGLFRSLYSYAPDNLAWLWSFLDWESPIDLSQVPVQEHYEPFEWCLQDAQQDDELLNRINKIFSDSPLIQYKYRENLMIADLYKFLEHVQKVNLKYIAISLFCLYFPRFAIFLDDQITPFLRPKILNSNLPLIKELDTMIIRLIKSRYSNLSEYKNKIITGNGLPSYVRSLLNECSFWSNPANKILTQSLLTTRIGNTTPKQQNRTTPVQTPSKFNEISLQEEKNLYQTLSYLKLLQKSTKINKDLDHTEEENQEDDLLEQQELNNILNTQPNGASQFSQIASPSLLDQNYFMNFPTDQQLISSPHHHNHHQAAFTPISNQNIANKILINTPQTPSNLNPYLFDKFDQSSLWSNNLTQTQPRLAQRYLSSNTPPPSACLKNKLDLNTDDQFTTAALSPQPLDPLMLTPSNHFNEDQLSKYFKNSAIITSPVQRVQQQKQLNDFSNFVGSAAGLMNQNQNTSLIGSINTNAQSIKYFNDLNIKTNQQTVAKSPLARSPVYSNLMPNIHHTWAGRLPPKIYSVNSLFSRKVFLGGLPWDVNQQYLLQLLHKYGSVKLEIPGKDLKHPRVSNMNKMQERSTPGYVYIIFDHESAVQRMLTDCRKEYKNGGEHYFYNIFIPSTYNTSGYNQINYANNPASFIKRGKSKEVEVIPWNQDDTSYVPLKQKDLPPKIDPKSTIFVGALHGMLNAQGLGKVMTEIFGEVIHAGLDTDKYKYPIGSGRVTFRDRQSYVKAIKAKFVTIKANLDPSDPSPKFEKTIQIDPYLEDAKCSKCDAKSYYFCRNECCLDYFCMQCWSFRHDMKNNGEHIPLSRQNKPTH